MQFSLKSLLIFMAVASVLCWLGYSLTRPFFTLARVDCGPGRYVELLASNDFCDRSGPLHYRFTGMENPQQPPFCTYWGCGYNPGFVVVQGASADVVGIASAGLPDEMLLVVDFKSKAHWPQDRSREVTSEAEGLLESLRAQHPETWLFSTYDGRLTKPQR